MNKTDLTLPALLLAPIAGALLAMMFPREHTGLIAAAVSFLPIGLFLPKLIGFEAEHEGLQHFIDESWIPELGIHFALGIDGISVFMVALTLVTWTIATFAAARKPIERPKLFFFMMALAETGTLGAFLAQDLILFVLFFDLLLIPFYFLIGIWGEGDRRAATAKFMIYTLAGSLLMFAAAIALGVSTSAKAGGETSFALLDLAETQVSSGTQQLIFAGFALALLVKMPLPPLHGWMPDTYRSAPLAVLIPLSAVVAKLGAYGFLRVVLPLMPDAVEAAQDLMLILALAGIVYGSVMAFTQDNARLVIGYSSIAQIGFVTLGIFAIDAKGAEGAVLQMLNHGLVVIPLFLFVGLLRERSGSDLLSQMGGIAKHAPVMAVLFLVVVLATLAMPGSANFVGELYILFGAFDQQFAYGAIASIGVVLAAVYMIRFYQRSMHNREGANVVSRDLDGGDLGLLVPVIAVLVAISVYPQYVVERIAPSAKLTAALVDPSQLESEGSGFEIESTPEGGSEKVIPEGGEQEGAGQDHAGSAEDDH